MAEGEAGKFSNKRRELNMDAQSRLENWILFSPLESFLHREVENSFALLIYIYSINLIETQWLKW